MSLRQKIAILVGIPAISLVVLVGYGSWSMKQVSGSMGTIVNDKLVALIDQKITPLIQEDMLPLINNDIVRMQELETSIQLMLEADRDVHQAVIAEKMSLVASEPEEIAAADTANMENIQQARERLAKASESILSPEGRQKYEEMVAAFNLWEESSRKVITLANTPGKLDFARKASDGGSAYQSFNAMRDLIDQLQTIQSGEIERQLAAVAIKKERVNQRDKDVRENRNAAVAEAGSVTKKATAAVPIFLGIGLLMALAVTVIGFFAARSISRPLTRLSVAAERIA